MIYLNTGIPGSGKTLNMVLELKKVFDDFETNPDSARPVFVSGIKELALPHSELPLMSVIVGKTVRLVPDWDSMPDNSLVIIDECQGIFPPRSTGSAIPDHVAFLNTHRHRGFDIWITTQSPALIDMNVRKLVGRHRYFRRLFGKAVSSVYEWDECSDNHRVKSAVHWLWKFPANVFDLYKSAEVHTKQTFRKPWWLYLVIVAPFALVGTGLYAYGVVQDEFTPKTTVKNAPSPSNPKGSGLAAGLPAAQAPSPFAGYVRISGKCYGVSRNGDTTLEPVACSEKL